MYSEQTGTIGYTKYQAICKYRLRYMKQCWLIRMYNFHWHMIQYTTFSMNKINFKKTSAEWNCSCQRNWRILSSMEFHGTARVSVLGAPKVLWNSMEILMSGKLAHFKFHGIPWNCLCQRNWRTLSSMEFHGVFQVPWNSMELLVSAKLAHSKFHGIPWNSTELLMSAKSAHS